jgi:hypothetical protein
MDPRLTRGIILLGSAVVFLAFSMFFLSKAQLIIDYGWAYVGGIGCDSCEFFRQSLLNYSLIFGVTSGLLGGMGIWIIAKRYNLATLPR